MEIKIKRFMEPSRREGRWGKWVKPHPLAPSLKNSGRGNLCWFERESIKIWGIR